MREDQIVKTAAQVFVIKDNKILLLKRQNTGYADGKYALPAGSVEDRERISVAAVRELKEEVNLDVAVEDLKHAVSMQRICDGLRIYWYAFFECNNFDESQIKNNEPHKCASLEWFDMDNLPENTVAYVSNAIQAYKNGIHYIEDDYSYLEEN